MVDSGCCGMAGSFGYEHYDLSMAIGERVLFPAVRQHSRADRRSRLFLPASDRARRGPRGGASRPNCWPLKAAAGRASGESGSGSLEK